MSSPEVDAEVTEVRFGKPTISLVVPLRTKADQFADFLGSLELQGSALQDIEIIFVAGLAEDDLSEMAESWLKRTKTMGLVLSSTNHRTSAALNAGIAQARGRWLNFPNHDDMLGNGYLRHILELDDKAEFAEAAMIVTSAAFFDENLNLTEDLHPLQFAFEVKPAMVDLNEQPKAARLTYPSSFYRNSLIKEANLLFDEEIVPRGEDAVFAAEYLLRFESPKILFTSQTEYLSRKHPGRPTLKDFAQSSEEFYTVYPRTAWCKTLRSANEKLGFTPAWLDFVFLYEIQWFFESEQWRLSPHKHRYGQVADKFLNDTREALSFINESSIREFDLARISRETTAALLALKGSKNLPDQIEIGRRDFIKNQVQLRYFFSGDQPREQFFVAGKMISPRYQKTRAIDYFGHKILFERIIWVPYSPSLSVTLDDRPTRLAELADFVGPKKPKLRPSNKTKLALRARMRKLARQVKNLLLGKNRLVRKLRSRIEYAISRSWPIRKKFENAWELMDTAIRAGENAEHFFRWLRKNHSEVNAYFILDKGTPEWNRLKADGLRLIANDSLTHRLLHHNSVVVVASHFQRKLMIRDWPKNPRGWKGKFVFLQHGILKDDVSRTYNKAKLDLFITSSPQEYESIAGDGNNYAYTEKEVVLTGLARFDELLRRANETKARDLITVTPTWRFNLRRPKSTDGSPMSKAEFLQTDFMKNWLDYLSNPALLEFAKSRDLKIVFMPHRLIAQHIDEAALPPEVEFLNSSETDVQGVLVRTALAVTDYSSIIMDNVYVGTPVVYLQFDYDDFFSTHGYREGYYDYALHAFGPVLQEPDSAVAATIKMLENPSEFGRKYRDRVDSFIPIRDQSNCERTYTEIVKMLTPEQEA